MTKIYTEKRQTDRHTAICKFLVEKDKSGYLMDISKSGAKLWVAKDKEVVDPFSIEIVLPYDVQNKSIDLNLNPVWKDETKSIRFNEVGCQFDNLDSKSKEKLDKIIDLFHKNKLDTAKELCLA